MNSIRRRLTIGLLIGSGLLGAVGGAVLYLTIRSGLVAEFDDTLRATAEGLAALTTQEKGVVEVYFSGESMPGFERRRWPDYFQIWRSDGTTVKRSPSLAERNLPNRAVSSFRGPGCWNLTLPDGRPGRAIGIRFVPQLEEDARDQPSPVRLTEPVSLVVARHRAVLDHRLRRVATALLLVGGALAAMTGFAVPIIVGRGLQPLKKLEEHVATIDAHTLQLRFPTGSLPAELRPICQRLNELLARLQASFERERRFSADVAHELRTPIAELRTLTEVALKWPEDLNTTRNALQDALAVALQMESIATGLLALARCEGGLLPVHLEPVFLQPLIKELSQPLSDQTRAKRITLSVVVPDDACWLADATLLRAIFTNLFSDAAQYCPAGGSVRLTGGTKGERGQLQVSNTTDDLGADDLPHLFERFWRKDPSRSSPEHCGLGLALTKAYAEALAMELRAELTNPREITLVLSGAQICSGATRRVD
ncbi:MAG: ATP-binding protein [Verrucomicrobiia bacterium]